MLVDAHKYIPACAFNVLKFKIQHVQTRLYAISLYTLVPVNICDTPEIQYVEMHVSRAHEVFAPLHVWITIRVEELACAWANHMYAYFTENNVKINM